MSTVRATLSATFMGQVCQNVIHFNNPDDAIPLDAIAAELADTWLTNMRQFQSTGVLWFDIETKVVSSGPSVGYHLPISLAGTGGSPAAGDLPQVGRVFKFITATPGRHGHGRLFVVGTPASVFNAGMVNSASLSAGAALINNLKARYLLPGGSFSCWLVLARRSDPSDTIPVSDIQQRALLGVQRRRSIGVGT